MRPSKRDLILEAAVEVIRTHGITGVTFESVAETAGITKGGLVYHFPSKEDLLNAIHEQRAAQWEARMIEVLGVEPEEASVDQRVAAYVKVAIDRATGPELLLMLEASAHPGLDRPWREVAQRWLPDPATIAPDDPASLTRLLAVIASDGLWVSDSLGSLTLPTELRAALIGLMLDLLAASQEH
jgi:AcrR family transcriptional regulator